MNVRCCVAILAAGFMGACNSGGAPRLRTTDVPPVILHPNNWRRFDPDEGLDGIKEAIGPNGQVTCHAHMTVQTLNDKFRETRPDYIELTQEASTTVPVEAIDIRRVGGEGNSKASLSGKYAASLGIPYLGGSSGAGYVYEFDAPVDKYQCTYTVSVSRLWQEDRGDVMLTGLPRYYYALNRLNTRNYHAHKLDASSGGWLKFGSVGGGFEDSLDSSVEFRNQIYAVGFLAASGEIPDKRFELMPEPFRVERFYLDETRHSSDQSAAFQAWRDRGTGEPAERDTVWISDPVKHKTYVFTTWSQEEKSVRGEPVTDPRVNEGASQRRRVTNFTTLRVEEYTGTDAVLRRRGGEEARILNNRPTLLSRAGVAPESATPYNSAVVIYDRGESAQLVWVDPAWTDRRDFVKFVP